MRDTAVPFLTENHRARDKYSPPESLISDPDAIVIGSGIGGMSIASVPVPTNEKLRESRLIKSIRIYVTRSAATILRSYLLYKPFKTFLGLGGVTFGLGVLLGLRFLWFFLGGQGAGHVQSVILASALLIIGVQLAMMGMLADLVAANRNLGEEALIRLRRLEAAAPLVPADQPAERLNDSS